MRWGQIEKLKAIKCQLASLIRQKAYYIPIGPEYPTKWWFGEVIDPRSESYFTYPGAWDFIADILEEDETIIKKKILDKPPGQEGYVFVKKTKWGDIYIKIHFNSAGNMVAGRSFHYPEKKE